jgi:hypothetical protein
VRISLSASRLVPRRAHSLSRAPPPPRHPQPAPCVSLWARSRFLPYSHPQSLSFTHASTTPPQHPTGADTLPLSPVTASPPRSNTCTLIRLDDRRVRPRATGHSRPSKRPRAAHAWTPPYDATAHPGQCKPSVPQPSPSAIETTPPVK